MHSIPSFADAVKAAPMPLPVKEQILDQVLGHHDDLYGPRRARRATTPMSVRVDAARQVGAFRFKKTTRAGDHLYTYCKAGEPAYEMVVQDGRPVHCGCKDFEIEAALDPDYVCKHERLFLEDAMDGATLTEGEVRDIVAEAADAAAEFERAWALSRLGRLPDGKANAAYKRLESARNSLRTAIAGRGKGGA